MNPKSSGKIVLATNGTYGDVHPFIALALRLRDLGHLPVVATSESYREKVEAEGIGFHAVRPGESDYQRDLGLDAVEITRRLATPGPRALEFVMRTLLMPYLHQSYEDMMAATEDAALVVTSSFAFAATLAAGSRQIPCVNVVLQPIMFASQQDPPAFLQPAWLRGISPRLARSLATWLIGALHRRMKSWAAPLDALSRQLNPFFHPGGPLLHRQFSAHGTIGLFSRELFGAVGPHLPPQTTIVGFARYDSERGGARALDEGLQRFIATGPPPIVFALGSQAVHLPGRFFREGAVAARSLGQRAVLVVGPGGRRHVHAQLPADVYVAEYIPYSEIFPRAAVIVHHGGIGTTGQALAAGRPQLIVPFWGDQLDNATRVVNLGVGRKLRRSQCTARNLVPALTELLTQANYLARAAEIGEAVAQEDGAGKAAKVIDDVLRRPPPEPEYCGITFTRPAPAPLSGS